MKYLILSLIVLSSSCSSMQSPHESTQIQSKKVECSPRALEYLKKEKTGPRPEKPGLEKVEALRAELKSKLNQSAHTCYGAELSRTDNKQPFNFCLVLGTDEQGRIEFHDFHTVEVKASDEFYNCLNTSIKTLDLSPYKNTNVIQPFYMNH